jgi:ankyrin repeat protein
LASIKDALSHLPTDSNAVFEASVLQITKYEPFENELAKHVLTWVAYAKVGLTINQVQDSFAIQRYSKGGSYQDSIPSKDLVISVSAGLIVENPESGTWRLVHESARQNLHSHDILPQNADLAMAKTCLTCLLIGGTEEERQSPLLPYAASHWISHLVKDCRTADAEVSNLVKRFFRNGTKLVRAFNIIQADPGSGLDGITELHAAVYFNLRLYAKDLIKARFDVNSRCSNGQTALHWAVKLGRHSISRYLIRGSADTNILDKTQHTPLHIALKGPVIDNIRTVQRLVDGGAKLDIPGPKGLTPLSWAIKYGPTAVAEILLKSQIDLNSEISPGWTSLRELFCHDHSPPEPPGSSDSASNSLQTAVEDHVRYLIYVVLDRGVDLDRATSDGWLPLTHAITTNSLSRVRALLNRNPMPADANKRDPKTNWSPLRWAIFRKNPAIVKVLGEHGADMNEKNEDGWVPLIQAVQNESEDIVWILLKMGARPETLDKQKRPVLLHAVQRRYKNIIWLLATRSSKSNIRLHSKVLLEVALANDDHSIAWLLCENGADPNATDGLMSLLHRACCSGRLKDVSFLLSQGADDSRLDNEGFTALHRAVLGNFGKVVEELVSRISRQEDLNIRDPKGNTALVLATLKGNESMVQTLLYHQASCETSDSNGVTAIHHAVGLGLNEILRLMMPKASNINFPDKRGYSALHHAVMSDKSNARTIDILVAGGADLNAKADDGKTALRLARDQNKKSFARQLLSLKEYSRSGAKN